MAKKPKLKPDDEEQSRRFVETARQLGVDESGKSFNRSLEKVVKKARQKTSSGH